MCACLLPYTVTVVTQSCYALCESALLYVNKQEEMEMERKRKEEEERRLREEEEMKKR